jgi:WD40 repeat protein
MGGGASTGKGKAWSAQFHLTNNEAYANADVFQEIFPVWTIAVTRNMKMLASATGNHKINLWCLMTHRLLISLSGHADTIWRIAFSPDDCLLASASADGTVRLWEVETGMLVQILPRCHANWVWTLAWSADGNRLATGGSDTRILVWNMEKVTDRARRCSNFRSESQSADARRRYAAQKEMNEAPDAQEVEDELSQPLLAWQAHEKSITELAFAPTDTRMLASVGAEGTVAVWDSTAGALDIRVMGHIGSVTTIAISPATDELIATGGEDHTVRLWDLHDIEPGSMYAKASREKEIGYNLAHFTLKGHEGGISAVRFTGDGRLLASASKDCEIRIWNPSRKAPALVHKFVAHEAWVRDIFWQRDQTHLFSGSTDGLIFAWQVPMKYHCKKSKRKAAAAAADH